MKKACRIRLENTRLFHPALFAPREEDEEEEVLYRDSLRPAETVPPEPVKTVLDSFGLLQITRDGSVRVSYEDSEVTGLDGHMTTFCLAPSGMLILLRRGERSVCMAFEEHHRHLCDYGGANTPPVTLHTHSLSGSLSENGGKICVDYSVEIAGCRTEHNRITLEATPV